VKKNFLLFVSLILLASLAACNMPTSQTQSVPDMETAAALTVQAVLTPLNSPAAVVNPVSTETPNSAMSATLAVTNTSTATTTPKLPTPTITPTYSVPMAEITGNTNCRTGPSQTYEIIYTFLPGAKTEIVGQYPQDNYWIVKLPNSSSTCWMWGGYATISGSFWVVPTATIPPTVTPSAPNTPSGLSFQYSCGAGGDITVTLTWHDNSDGEEGFRVLKDGAVVAQLPSNSVTYTDVFYGVSTQKYSYAIEVFSGSMTARSGTISFSCQ
jgi:hypothetical protein